jgi:NAD(P)-dependent dehydrogenase (short-subunit alcohol dehydrogenase family)
MLDGRLAAVTGAGRGLGVAVARGLARSGARVLLLERSAELGREAQRALRSEGLDAHALVLDVADAAACAALAASVRDAHGPIDILVNNAGINSATSFCAPDALQDWARILEVNLGGCAHVTHAFVPQLQARRGVVLNIASIAAFTAGTSSFSYVVSKGAIRSLTQVLARDLAPSGVRVNALAPSLVATEMNERKRENKPLMDAYLRRVMLGRVGTLDDVVGPALFLCCDLAAYITGTVLPVDGGYLAS